MLTASSVVEAQVGIARVGEDLEVRAKKLGMKRYRSFEADILVREMLFDKNGNVTADKRWSKGKGNFISHFEYAYDDNNVLTDKITYNAGGEIISTDVYEVNAKGNKITNIVPGNKEYIDQLNTRKLIHNKDSLLIEEVAYRFGKHSISTVYVYHPNKKVKTKSQFRGEDIKAVSLLEFDDEGRTIENIRYGSDGKIQKKTKTKYNDKGDPISRKTYDASNTLVMDESTDRDKKGNVTARYKWQKGWDEKKKVFVFEYNKSGNLLHKYGADPSVTDFLGTYTEESNTYDDKKRLSKTVYNKGYNVYRTDYTYNDDGSVKETYYRCTSRETRPKDAIENDELWLLYRSQTKHTESGKVLEEENFVKGKLATSTTYTYDANWNMTSMKSGAVDGSRGREMTQTHDDKNRLLESKEYKIRDGKKVLAKESRYNFDQFDNQTLSYICRKLHKPDGKECKEIQRVYNDKGLIIEQKEYENDALMKHFKYRYNNNDRLTHFVTLYGQALYKYDAKGEMIEQRFENKDGEVSGKNSWTIEYY